MARRPIATAPRAVAPTARAPTAAAPVEVTGRASGLKSATLRATSGSLEGGVALLHEGRHALEEVLGPGQSVLELGLEVELAVEIRIDHAVERFLGARVGAGGAA